MINQILEQSVIEGNVLRLPEGQLDRNVYLEVKKAMDLIGGKWKSGKVAGFVFPADPTALVQKIIEGHQPNLKKEFQFFATPADIADEMVRLSGLGERGDHPKVLEPSAGQGALIDAAFRVAPNALIEAYELMPINYDILKEKYFGRVYLKGKDFLVESCVVKDRYDVILANPPFTKNQDIDHIHRMLRLLSPGGRLVTVASNHWRYSENKKEKSFKDLLENLGAVTTDIERGAFKSSGTMVGSCIVVVDK